MRITPICLLLSCAMATGALAAPAHVDTTIPLELKGQALGSRLDEVQTRFPGVSCEDVQPGLTKCTKDDTLAEAPAKLEIRYLDGVLISISYQRIDFKTGLAIDAALRDKFGPPNERQVNGTVDGGTYRQHRRSMWTNGGQVLDRNPMGERDDKHDRTYTEVWLVDSKAWDSGWLPRAKGQQLVKDL